MREVTTVFGRQVPVDVYDQYAAAALTGILANATLLEGLVQDAVMRGKNPVIVAAKSARGYALALIAQRNTLLHGDDNTETMNPPKQ